MTPQTAHKSISIRQLMLLLISMTLASVIRISPRYLAQAAMQGAWLAPLSSMLVMLLQLILLYGLLKDQREDLSLYAVTRSTVGRGAADALMVVGFLWALFVVGLYCRNFAIVLTTTLFPYIRPMVFILLMLAVVAFILYRGMVSLGRMNEIIFWVLTLTIVLVAVLLIPETEFRFLTPLANGVLGRSFTAGLLNGGNWVFLLIPLLPGGLIRQGKGFMKHGMKAVLILGVLAVLAVNITVGTLSADLVAHMPQPIFFAIKQVESITSLQKNEALIITLSLMSDFVMVAVLILSMQGMLARLCRVKDAQHLNGLLVVAVLLFSLALASGNYELEAVAQQLELPLNLILGLGIPILLTLCLWVKKLFTRKKQAAAAS